MKTLLTSILTLAFAPAMFADVAIYTGSAVVKTTSDDATGTVVSKLTEIIDLATGESQSINLIKRGPVKQFRVEPAIPSTVVMVTGSKAHKAYTVISFASTATDAATGVTGTTSLLLKGQVLSAQIKGTEKSAVATQLQGTSTLVSTSGTDPADLSDIASALVISTPVLNLNLALSRTANDAGHTTVATALEDVKASLIAAGYVEQP